MDKDNLFDFYIHFNCESDSAEEAKLQEEMIASLSKWIDQWPDAEKYHLLKMKKELISETQYQIETYQEWRDV